MNKLVKRGFSAYKIFLKNKLAMSLMMLFSGIMMFIAAINGHGNDTKTLPLVITIAGAVFSFWGFYRLGYMKSNYDHLNAEQSTAKAEKKLLFFQVLEASLYVVVAVLGIILLTNEGLVNKVLNLMAGGFTTFNGVLGAISAYRNRNNKDFRWKFMLVLMVIELIVGPYFIFASDSINSENTAAFIIMGCLTMVAGTIEVISALTMETIKNTVKDGRDIVRIIKDKEDGETA